MQTLPGKIRDVSYKHAPAQKSGHFNEDCK